MGRIRWARPSAPLLVERRVGSPHQLLLVPPIPLEHPPPPAPPQQFSPYERDGRATWRRHDEPGPVGRRQPGRAGVCCFLCALAKQISAARRAGNKQFGGSDVKRLFRSPSKDRQAEVKPSCSRIPARSCLSRRRTRARAPRSAKLGGRSSSVALSNARHRWGSVLKKSERRRHRRVASLACRPMVSARALSCCLLFMLDSTPPSSSRRAPFPLPSPHPPIRLLPSSAARFPKKSRRWSASLTRGLTRADRASRLRRDGLPMREAVEPKHGIWSQRMPRSRGACSLLAPHAPPPQPACWRCCGCDSPPWSARPLGILGRPNPLYRDRPALLIARCARAQFHPIRNAGVARSLAARSSSFCFFWAATVAAAAAGFMQTGDLGRPRPPRSLISTWARSRPSLPTTRRPLVHRRPKALRRRFQNPSMQGKTGIHAPTPNPHRAPIPVRRWRKHGGDGGDGGSQLAGCLARWMRPETALRSVRASERAEQVGTNRSPAWALRPPTRDEGSAASYNQ
ncbi:uncharacterized protein K452DRAFT_73730 [Aplosporella prunicola CBS 121167]|uniref:Uncharacterized protein n=1 Tax=Aplosporella prunicola CBS 121167 TaxID=1176127 RepID=A0A6A6B6E7_9PEZI|nr:uncharacterized protein K452DRAFT_73730 [Aplosporella prunicola CBS 121167]KAF2139218.1 hypothetical protein K452DRAFT_73730 [Aplosporella prunicola CBS 121167]